jgi:hypothetical protein
MEARQYRHRPRGEGKADAGYRDPANDPAESDRNAADAVCGIAIPDRPTQKRHTNPSSLNRTCGFGCSPPLGHETTGHAPPTTGRVFVAD